MYKYIHEFTFIYIHAVVVVLLLLLCIGRNDLLR